MFEELPKDPMLLLSVINTKLRDYYPNLDLLCEELQIDSELSLIHISGNIFIFPYPGESEKSANTNQKKKYTRKKK